MKRIISYNLYKILAVMFLSALIFSCNEVLDKTPIDSYSDAAVWNDEALTEAFANTTYKYLPHGFVLPSGLRFLPYANISDECNSRNSWSTVGIVIMGNQSSAYGGPLDVWTKTGSYNGSWNYWKPISQVNKFLDKMDESTIDEELKNRLIAEMRTIRAYSYFKLISHFGGVPLITKSFSLDDDFRIPRNTYEEVLDFIIKELDESINSLPLEYSAENDGRITKGAAMAIKSRTLLYAASPLNNPNNDQAKWQAAADALKDVIDLGIYSLHSDYKELFTEAGGYNTPEVIWGRPFNIDVEVETLVERWLYPNGWLGFGHSHPLQNLIDDYEMSNGLKIEDAGSGYDPQNPYVNRDPRFYYTILYDGAPFKERTIETFTPGGLDSPDGIESAWNASETGYYPRKFINEAECGCTSTSSGSSSPTWIYLRYGEILLNYAEAMFMLGNEDVCREYINLVRNRPGVEMPPVTESGEALWERLVNERRVELVFEEHRYFDVVRWKVATEVFSQDRTRMLIQKDPATGVKTYNVSFFQPANFNEWNYLAPIPQIVIDQNSLIEQNPGY